jgi:hypothetical protein
MALRSQSFVHRGRQRFDTIFRDLMFLPFGHNNALTNNSSNKECMQM